ncbi:hypothetical protein C2G38_2142680 [Gigaspora rosea]|uniref:BTB/POZ domain-containing protein n=1 Tax=Gigaspora rosea TaxID=44941 RepID=A0A397VD72_9GLOM|nr:hypothetical protein C2G38_2142680 [Gigaspora rosea]
MELNLFEELSNNYLDLLNTNEDFDVIINVEEVSNIKTFHAHSLILKRRSLYFRKELSNANKDQDNNKIIHLRNVSIQNFEIIIRYIYGGTLSLERNDESFIFEFILVSQIFFLEELVKRLENYLIKEKDHWLRSKIVHIHQIVSKNNCFQELQKWCNETVARDPKKVFNSENFVTLQENALVSLIGRDDLQMKEVEIWKSIIKWGISQVPGLPNYLTDWSHEHFQVLKTTLQHCLPLIRYFQMSANDIANNVKPYKQILDEDLWNDISKKFEHPDNQISSIVLPPRIILVPIRAINQFSKVINEEDAAEIASWIDLKNNPYSVENNPYEFNLLLRGSRDGFTSKAFWKLCNGEENLVVVIKVEGTDEILGGYNPIGWIKPANSIGEYGGPHGEYEDCDECFIFSLKNSTLQESILSLVKSMEYAVHNARYCGPAFGGVEEETYGCNFDLVLFIEGETCYCEQSSYEKPIRKLPAKRRSWSNSEMSYFSVEEYEIFQVVKKS